MPTKEWFEENPKVSAYITQDLNKRLEQWMKDRKIKKVSQALTEILEIHLSDSNEPEASPSLPINSSRLETLEGKLRA